jgi:hypothetical protein
MNGSAEGRRAASANRLSGGATPRARGRLSAAVGCTEPTMRGSSAVTATWSERLSHPWRTDHAVRRRRASAHRRLRSPRDPRRGDRVGEGAIVGGGASAPAPWAIAELRSATAGEHEPPAAMSAGCLHPSGSELATGRPAAAQPGPCDTATPALLVAEGRAQRRRAKSHPYIGRSPTTPAFGAAQRRRSRWRQCSSPLPGKRDHECDRCDMGGQALRIRSPPRPVCVHARCRTPYKPLGQQQAHDAAHFLVARRQAETGVETVGPRGGS